MSHREVSSPPFAARIPKQNLKKKPWPVSVGEFGYNSGSSMSDAINKTAGPLAGVKVLELGAADCGGRLRRHFWRGSERK